MEISLGVVVTFLTFLLIKEYFVLVVMLLMLLIIIYTKLKENKNKNLILNFLIGIFTTLILYGGINTVLYFLSK